MDIEALAAEPPLLDEIEFTKLCEDAINVFKRDVCPYDGCYTLILGPEYGPPAWLEGRYSALTLREAQMMVGLLHERLGLIYDPDNLAHAWAEVATDRFVVSSRNPDVVPR